MSATHGTRTALGGLAARALTVVAALAVLAGVAVTVPAAALAVSGGARADDTASAFAVRIDIARTATSTWTCSGSLVAPELVLTAAHCLYSRNPADWSLTFAAGPGATEKRGVRAVLPYSPEAGAGPVTSVDDLGLVQLDRPVTDRAPVRLDRDATLDRLAGTRGPVVEIGYGGVQPAATPVAERAGQIVLSTGTTLPSAGVRSLAPLVETGPAATPVLPTLPSVPGGSCEPGDSGGPLVSGGVAAPVLLGVTSRGSETGRCWFTRVDSASPYRAWLDDKITRFGGASPAPERSERTRALAPAIPGATAPPAALPAALPATAPAVAPAVTTPAVTPVAAPAVTPAAAPAATRGPVVARPAGPARDTVLITGLGGLADSAAGRLAVGAPLADDVTTTAGAGAPVPVLAPVSASGTPPWATGR